jgi:transcriptional regulator with AAA-type ATPase domain
VTVPTSGTGRSRGQTVRPLPLRVGWLGGLAAAEPQEWVGGLRDYLGFQGGEARRRTGPRDGVPPEPVLDIDVGESDVRGSQDLQRMIWRGTPFVLVGSRTDVEAALGGLLEPSRRVLADHAYWWIVTEPDAGEAVEAFLQSELGDAWAAGRTVVVEWPSRSYRILREELAALRQYPGLAGLSRELRHVRKEIARIGGQQHGAWSPVLIVGDSGVGKTEVALALHREASRDGELRVVRCGVSSEDLLRDELLGHVAGAFNAATSAAPGLVELHSRGTLLLTAVDAAPPGIQAALLSVVSAPRGSSGSFSRIGTVRHTSTDVWLLLATNTPPGKVFGTPGLHLDFLFRCEDRVIYVPPLRARPADAPALAARIWADLATTVSVPRELPPDAVEALFHPKTQWEGNVRALRTLLTLAFGRAHQQAAMALPVSDVIREIYRRGPEYQNWIGMIQDPPPTVDPRVSEIVALDRADACDWTGGKGGWPATGSELAAREILDRLGADRVARFEEAIRTIGRGRADVRPSVRLSRLVCYMGRHRELTVAIGQELGRQKEGTVRNDLDALIEHGVIEPVDAATKPIRYVLRDGTPPHAGS